MSTPARVLYASQTATIDGTTYPIQSMSLDITNPIDDVLVFGQLGSAARAQKEVSKTKITVKTILASGGANAITYSGLAALTGKAISGTYSTIVLSGPAGFTGSGIISNIAIDASMGNFVTCDLSFEGAGQAYVGTAPGSIISTPTATTISVSPVTSNYVAAGYSSANAACVSSAKFSLDIPNEMVTCLGSEITGDQTAVFAGIKMVAKPPFKATITVEGTAASQADTIDFGPLYVKLSTNAKVISQSYNQAVGTVGATYNFTMEDVICTFGTSDMSNGPTVP
jgi:hypothetical protein